MTDNPNFSIVVPVFGNASNIELLLHRLEEVSEALAGRLEVVFVVDGSPDDSAQILRHALEHATFTSQLLEHSRNFGSFSAIRTGLEYATGTYAAVMAADLQEPPELVLEFFKILSTGEIDVVVGRRIDRSDPIFSTWASTLYWKIYRAFIFRDMPIGGVDIFACNRRVINAILQLKESHATLIGQIYWIGFRRAEVPYSRLPREVGRSGWTLAKKLAYFTDSIFSFTDLPLRAIVGMSLLGTASTLVVALFVLISYANGLIDEPGYTPVILVTLFCSFAVLGAVGMVGLYVWRTFENTKQRPDALVQTHKLYSSRKD